MGLNESKGNMYEFVTHTWNAIKGECKHDCTYSDYQVDRLFALPLRPTDGIRKS